MTRSHASRAWPVDLQPRRGDVIYARTYRALTPQAGHPRLPTFVSDEPRDVAINLHSAA